MPRLWLRLAITALAVLLAALPTIASHNADLHSANMKLLANLPKPNTTNSDLAFWGTLAFAGHYGGVGVIDIANPSKPKVLADFPCNGPQNDVSVWQHLLFLSIDRPQDREPCAGSTNTPGNLPGFEGIRILDVSDPGVPRFVKAVPTACGSHTHTLVPDLANNRVLLYVSSYPLVGQGPECNAHFRISVVEVPLGAPQDARVIREPTLSVVGCHDIGVFLPLRLAAAACLTEGQLWDISDPADPQTTSAVRIVNPAVNIWHSGGFTWDGEFVIFGDEFAGAAAPGGCATPNSAVGRVWFHKRTSPAQPVGSFAIPRSEGAGEVCEAHSVPRRHARVRRWKHDLT